MKDIIVKKEQMVTLSIIDLICLPDEWKRDGKNYVEKKVDYTKSGKLTIMINYDNLGHFYVQNLSCDVPEIRFFITTNFLSRETIMGFLELLENSVKELLGKQNELLWRNTND